MAKHRSPLPVGKPAPEILERLFRLCPVSDPRVVVGPRVGEDAAVIDAGDRYLVAKVDPITFATEEIGWYAVNINANDLAVRGASPRWFLMTLLLPEGGATEDLLEGIFLQVDAACRALGATLVGGHTEVTYGLERPILAGAMLGEVAKDALVTTAGARPGDAILLTKGIAIEGTALIARERAGDLQRQGIGQDLIARARNFLRDPGISVVPDARVAVEAARVHAMHDPTEGGLSQGLYELCEAAGVGVVVREEAIEVLPECRALCSAYGLEPLGTIASGALILTCAASDADALLAAYSRAGIRGTVIGGVVPRERGATLVGPEGARPLPRFPRDEIARLFEREEGRG